MWLIYQSESFQTCIQQDQPYQAAQAFQKGPTYFARVVAFGAECVGTALEQGEHAIVPLATIAIAIFTYTLWRSTYGLWVITREAAEALPLIERAYVYAKVGLDDIGFVQNQKGLWETKFRVLFVNRGKTPAALVQLRAYTIVRDTAPTQLIEFAGSDTTLPEGYVIATDKAWEDDVDCVLTAEDYGQIGLGNKFVYCCGLISYRDVLGKDRETGFCWHLQFHKNRTRVLISQSPLNYTR